ncbi:DUF294 nucleotidyltransferase-like domain-containing protein [Vibrio rumoiensis]|uniref:DUF294 nucleotidyltransferase-like domain-containing protein n=1 Tax=Vibrio rumoiensis TaxID=76258 RepID=UPI000B5C8036|nr:DUF294 nucleotidyltransferase-like domain-containing protein [Vibrio rumoiensis]
MNNGLLPNIVSFLQAIYPFSELPKTVLNNIAQTVDILFLSPEQQLKQDDNATYLYILRSGVIQQNHLDGSLRSLLGEEDIFGFNLHNRDSESYLITALENTLLYRFDYLALMAQLQDYPQITSQLALSLQTRLQAIQTQHRRLQPAQHYYMRPSIDIASRKILIVSATESIQDVAHQMRDIVGVSCAFIVDHDQCLIGMVTDKDMTKRVVAQALDVSGPISHVMTQNVHTVYEDELVIAAVHLMMKHQIQNIPVVNHQQQVTGLITPQHLIQNNGVQSIFLIDQIHRADSITALIKLSEERNLAFEGIIESSATPNVVGQVLSMIYDAFSYRLIELAIKIFGQPPCAFSWIVAGSHARNEVHLASDQDNALILADSATEADRIYFQHFAMYVCKGLSQLGYTLCKGRFMAATPQWCQKQSIWKAYYRKWATNPEYDLLLNLNVFLEVRHIYGDEALFQSVDEYRHQQVSNNTRLTSALVRNALRTRPPLGIFKNLVLEKDGNDNQVLNIKKAAIGRVVDLVRIYSLMNDSPEINTTERIEWLHKHRILNDSTYQDLSETYHYVTELRYQRQRTAIQTQSSINNLLQPDKFGSFERQHLKDAFRIISSFQDLIKMKYGR